MSRNRLLYITLAVALLVFSAAYQSRISAVLLIAVLCYPILALICVIICSRLTDVGFVEQEGHGNRRNHIQDNARIIRQKNEVYDLWIYVRSRSILPCVPIELQCNIPDRDTGLFSNKRIYASVPPLGRCRISVSVMHRYRGAYIAEINRAAFFDPLRIIRINRRLSEEAMLIFLPRRRDIGELIAEAPGEDSTDPLPLIKGEREDFSHVREYIQGDMMQQVHWKLTAKLDELMIKQFDEASEKRVAILCDYRTDKTDAGTAMKQADSMIEAAIAIALATVKSGVNSRVDFGAIDGSHRSSINDMADFERFYDCAAVMPTKLETMDTVQLLETGQQGASVVFLITGRMTEELLAAVENAAESFRGIFVLVNVSPGTSPELESRAKDQRFEYLPLKDNDAK